MSEARVIYILAALCGAAALWLLLPRASDRGRLLGAVLGVVSLGLLASRVGPIGDWLDAGMLWTLSAVTILSAAATVTFRNPVYCAIWFAITLLAISGLFFFQGAQFLGVATVVVYAGAILVTFLFVLMLANPKGHAYYDRLSWEPWLAAPAAALMLVVLTLSVSRTFKTHGDRPPLRDPIAASARGEEILAGEHMAHLGRRLFSEYLIAVEGAGTLLLVGLVGAIAIVAQDKSKSARAGRHE